MIGTQAGQCGGLVIRVIWATQLGQQHWQVVRWGSKLSPSSVHQQPTTPQISSQFLGNFKVSTDKSKTKTKDRGPYCHLKCTLHFAANNPRSP